MGKGLETKNGILLGSYLTARPAQLSFSEERIFSEL